MAAPAPGSPAAAPIAAPAAAPSNPPTAPPIAVCLAVPPEAWRASSRHSASSPGDPGGVRIVVGIHRRLVAAHGGAARDDECESKQGFAHGRLALFSMLAVSATE